jgi:hypothetical protein
MEENTPNAAPIRSRGKTAWMMTMACGGQRGRADALQDPGGDQLAR